MRGERAEDTVWPALVNEYLVYIEVERGLSPRTVEAYGRDLLRWVEFISGQGRGAPEDVQREDITLFLEEMRGRGLSPRSLARMTATLRGLQRFLADEGSYGVLPIADLPTPRHGQALPRVLSQDEVARLLEQPMLEDPPGLRDRAILETLYGTGIRISELTGLDIEDMDLTDRELRVLGKGARERVVPVGDAAAASLRRYLGSGRPKMARSASQRAVFLNQRGGILSAHGTLAAADICRPSVEMVRQQSPGGSQTGEVNPEYQRLDQLPDDGQPRFRALPGW